MQIADSRRSLRALCSSLNVMVYKSAQFSIYHILAPFGAGLDVNTGSVTNSFSHSKQSADQLRFTVFTCCSSSP